MYVYLYVGVWGVWGCGGLGVWGNEGGKVSVCVGVRVWGCLSVGVWGCKGVGVGVGRVSVCGVWAGYPPSRCCTNCCSATVKLLHMQQLQLLHCKSLIVALQMLLPLGWEHHLTNFCTCNSLTFAHATV